MKQIKNIKKYENKWVLLNEQGNEVLKAGNTFKEVLKALRGRRDKRIIFKVPPSNLVYSP